MRRKRISEIDYFDPKRLHKYCIQNPGICTRGLWLKLLKESFPDAYRVVAMVPHFEPAIKQRVARINFEPLQDLYAQLLLVSQNSAEEPLLLGIINEPLRNVSQRVKEKIRLYYQTLSFLLSNTSQDWLDYLRERDDPVLTINSAIIIAARQGDVELLEHLLRSEPEFDVRRALLDAFREAATAGQTKVVDFLLHSISIFVEENDIAGILIIALSDAAIAGNIDMIRILLADPRINPQDRGGKAFLVAIRNGYLDIVKLLLTDRRIDPSINHNEAFILAAKTGRTDIVRLLLRDPRVDPFDQDGAALRLAQENGHMEIARLLEQLHSRRGTLP